MSAANSSIAKEQLRSFIERIQRLDEEIKTLKDDRKSIMSSAKAAGFHTPTLNRIISELKKPREQRRESENIYESYMFALGELDYEPQGGRIEEHVKGPANDQEPVEDEPSEEQQTAVTQAAE